MAYDKSKANKNAGEGETKNGSDASNKRPSNTRGNRGNNQKAGRKAVPVNSVANALIATAANISFPVTAGFPLSLNFEGAPESGGFKTGSFSMPGIMRIGFIPTPGRCEDWSDPFATATRDFYSLVRHQNSGHSNYTAASLGMYILAGTSCYDYLAYMQRMAGLVRAYGNRNGYLPERVVAAAGGDYTSLATNLANLITYINSFAVRLSAMKLPALPFIASHAEMLINVYRDCDSEKSSFYVFSPDSLWVHEYGETAEDSGMMTVSVPHKMSYEQIVNLGEELLNKLLNDEMFNIMSGDIMKATTELMPVTLMSPEDVCTPVYDPMMLVRIHNATALWRHPTVVQADLADWTIKEDLSVGANVGAFLFNPHFRFPGFGGTDKDSTFEDSLMYAMSRKIVDLPVDAPDPGLIADISRFSVTAMIHNVDTNGPLAVYQDFGTEILTSILISYMDRDVVNPEPIQFVTTLDKFDYAPYYVAYDSVASSNGTYQEAKMAWVAGPLLNNYTTIGFKELHEIHRAYMLTRLGMIK